jgi:CRP/FNR family transcriptional regulator
MSSYYKKRKISPPPDCITCSGRPYSVFCNLSIDELKKLNESKECFTYSKGENIFLQGTQQRELYCVHSGKIKLVQNGEEGKEQIIELIKKGDILGYKEVFSDLGNSCTAIAMEDTTVCLIPQKSFIALIEKNTRFALNIFKLFSSKLRAIENTLVDFVQKPAQKRVAKILILLKDLYGFSADNSTINISIKRDEIASIAGITRETATRILYQFHRDKIVELVGKRIKILNLQNLIKIANGR